MDDRDNCPKLGQQYCESIASGPTGVASLVTARAQVNVSFENSRAKGSLNLDLPASNLSLAFAFLQVRDVQTSERFSRL